MNLSASISSASSTASGTVEHKRPRIAPPVLAVQLGGTDLPPWLNALHIHDYQKTFENLIRQAITESRLLQRKKTALSLAKLCFLANELKNDDRAFLEYEKFVDLCVSVTERLCLVSASALTVERVLALWRRDDSQPASSATSEQLRLCAKHYLPVLPVESLVRSLLDVSTSPEAVRTLEPNAVPPLSPRTSFYKQALYLIALQVRVLTFERKWFPPDANAPVFDLIRAMRLLVLELYSHCIITEDWAQLLADGEGSDGGALVQRSVLASLMAIVQLDSHLRVALELEPAAATSALEQLQHQQAGAAAEPSRALALVLAVPSVEQLLEREARTEVSPEEGQLVQLFTAFPSVSDAVHRLLTSFRQPQHSPALR